MYTKANKYFMKYNNQDVSTVNEQNTCMSLQS